MDDSTAEAADITSPKLTAIPKVPPKVYEKNSPGVAAVSPLGKSRYGRTRKPKITEDFYDIDAVIESVKESKKSPRPVQQVKTTVSKVTKPKQPQPPTKPKNRLSPTLKSPEINSKPAQFAHITGDQVVTQSASPKAFMNDTNSKAIHNFFNEESGMSLLQSATEPKTEVAKQTDVTLMAQDVNALAPSLSDEPLSLQSVDVTKVLKIISAKSPDPLQNNLDAKTSFKPVLKTYSNKRKNFNKVSVVESFGLPDKPIFPIESETSAGNEPKRIKNLDVAAPSSEKDINLVDKKLLDTPWKIASLNNDITENETLLESCSNDFKNEDETLYESEFLSPLKENVANKKLATPSQIIANEMLSTKIPIPRKKLEKSAVIVGVEKKSSVSEKADFAKVLKTKSPRKQKLVVKELSVIRGPSCKDIKKGEEVENSELHASKMRLPRKRTQDIQQAVSALTDAQPNLVEDAGSPKKEKQITRSTSAESSSSPKKMQRPILDESQSTRTQNYDILQPTTRQKDVDTKLHKDLQSHKKLELRTMTSPRRQPKVMLIKIEHTNARLSQRSSLPKRSFEKAVLPKSQIRTINIKVSGSPKSPTKQKLPVAKSTENTPIQNDEKSAEYKKNIDAEILKATAEIEKKSSEISSPNKRVKSSQSVANISPDRSPVKAISQKRKRSESPKKSTSEHVTQHEGKTEEMPIVGKKARGRPRKCPVVVSETVKDTLDAGSLVHDSKDIVEESTSSIKRSSRSAKSSMGTVHDVRMETPDTDIATRLELDEMSLLDRKSLPSSTTTPAEASETLNDEVNLPIGAASDGKNIRKDASSPIKRSSRLAKSSLGGVNDPSKDIPRDDPSMELDEMSLLKRRSLPASTLIPVEATETLDDEVDPSIDAAGDEKNIGKDASSPIKRSSRLAKSSLGGVNDVSKDIPEDDPGMELDEMSLLKRRSLPSSTLNPVEASETLNDKIDLSVGATNNGKNVGKEGISPIKRSSRLAKSSLEGVNDASKGISEDDSIKLDEMSLLARRSLLSSTLSQMEASNDKIDISVGTSNARKNVGKEGISPIKRSSRLAKSSLEGVNDASKGISEDDSIKLDEMSLLARRSLLSSTLSQMEASNDEIDLSVGASSARKNVEKEGISSIKRSSRLAKSSLEGVNDASKGISEDDPMKLDEMSLLARRSLLSSTLSQMEASNDKIDLSVGASNGRKNVGKEGISPIKRSSRLAKSSLGGVNDVSKEIPENEPSMELDEMSLLDRKSLNSSYLNPDITVLVNKSVRRSARGLGTAETEQSLLPDVTTVLQESENDTITSSKRKHLNKQQFVPVDTNGNGFNVKEELQLEDSNSVADIRDVSESDNIALGDLMWARIRGFPYWPCLITEDPATHEYKMNTIKRSAVLWKYHVRFFGDKGRRSWIYQTSLIRFNGKNDLNRLYNEVKDKPVPSMLLQSYIVKANIRIKWENAASEAESLKSSTVQERFDFFFNMFASEKEKRKKLEEVVSEIKFKDWEDDAEMTKSTEHHSRSKVEVERSPITNTLQSLPAHTADEVSDDLKVKRGIKSKTKDGSEKLALNEQEDVFKLTKTEEQQLTELNLKHNSAVQKRASKIKERQESNDSSIDESGDMFLKNPWQGFHMPKKSFGTLLNEANSECSLSDTDSLSKSSSNTSIPNTFKAQVTRQKRNNLFRGVPKDRVCQICKKPGDILKCKGPCSGIFHYKCAAGRYTNESTTIIKEEPMEPISENEQLCDEESAKNDLDVNVMNGLPDTTHADELDHKNETENNEKENNGVSVDQDKNETTVMKEVKTKGKNPTDITDSVVDASNSNNNKVEIVYIDCDESDFEHNLTPKVRLTPTIDFSKFTLAEQIDMKMKEIMQKHEKSTRYADSTTDYTSSEESSSNLPPPAPEPKVVQKKKPLKIKHVTADHISFASSASSEDLICESTNQEVNGSVSSTKSAESSNKEKGKLANIKNGEALSNEEKHVTGDVPHVTGDVPHVTGDVPHVTGDVPHVTGDSTHVTGDVTPRSEGSNESNFNKDDFKDFKCGYCIAEVEPPCFVCNKEISSKSETFRQKCSIYMCGKFYHPGCLKMWPQTQWSLISTAKHKNSDKLLDTFVCPAHVCHTCASDDPHAAISRCTSDKVVKCLHCPATYHTTNYCVPAGTIILSTSQIVCPRHLRREVVRKGKVSKLARTINTPWCFICSKGGDLICCETCPTSVHTDCLAINLLEDGTFICEDCETGRFPLYDEIVWVKLGTYRWWPAVILFPNEIPNNIKNIPHCKGEFVVKFFGTHDHYWVGRGRVFLFQEGDRGHCSPTKKRVDALFKKSIEEAAVAHQTKKIFKKSKEAEIRTGMKPPPYIRVKVNKPVGNVRLFDGNISNTTSCECDPNQDFPCGPDSDCLNRLLLTECDPNICPAKNNCNNQRFEKRQYPPLMAYKTPSRGWGLKTLAPIRKGDFVIEYVGEVIDDQEYQRRIRKMHEQKDENYYFLTIDKDRIIDAGPKGNLARFMNHCCQPNCETQKWTVNGDTRVGLFAMEDIAADAELTFNYNLECIGTEKKICKCGAPRCSGFIGVKAKQDESQKKPKKGNNNMKKKKRSITPQVFKCDGPCFICGQSGDVGACHNKICTKFYHLQCVNLDFWPEGKWVCPWHNCSICTKRTIRCCVKCINSYCPVHSEGNVRYDKLLGFVCSEHDPTKESHELSNQNLTVKSSKNPTTVLSTEETDVTSTTSDEVDHPIAQVFSSTDLQAIDNIDLIATESVTSTPIKKKNIANFAYALQEFESSEIPKLTIPKEQAVEKRNILVAGKRKRGRQKQANESTPKRMKISEHVNEAAVKLKPSFAASTLLGLPTQHEIKLSSSVPARHLRTTRNNTPTSVENKRFLKQQNELEKDLPIRKRSRPRCEATL